MLFIVFSGSRISIQMKNGFLGGKKNLRKNRNPPRKKRAAAHRSGQS